LLAIVGPDRIVMVGDNDAGASVLHPGRIKNHGNHFGVDAALLVPVLFCRPGNGAAAASHRWPQRTPDFERFGKFWGAFSVIDLLLPERVATIITEFIGISLGLQPPSASPRSRSSPPCSTAAASTGSFKQILSG
jgi:hypothetical protein